MYEMAKMKLKYELIVFALWPPQGCTMKQVRHSWPEIIGITLVVISLIY